MIHGVAAPAAPGKCTSVAALSAIFVVLLAGCGVGPTWLKPDQQTVIDRRDVEYPAGAELKPYITGLTAPTAIAFDSNGSLLIAEGGMGDYEPRVIGYKPDGTSFQVYPGGKRLLAKIGRRIGQIVGVEGFRIYGPIGGMIAANGKVYVSHRDEQGHGAVTAFDYEGNPKTIVADLPAEGDYGVTDIAIAPNGRLYFGAGTATNSGVVGLDNMPWLRKHRDVCDKSWGDLYLLGRRFDSPNPFAGLFGGIDLAVTAPFLPFGMSSETHILRASNGKPNGAIYSVDPNGGDLRVEAHGIRYPMGLAFSEPGALYVTNQGMKLRGTRPVKDDPDVMLRMVHGQWYGWPDFSANLLPIRDARFQPPVELIVKSGYRNLSFLIDQEASGLASPNQSSNLVAAEFRPLAGAAKFDFAPGSGPFSRLRQAGNVAIVALMGDRAPLDTSDRPLVGHIGYRVVQVNVNERQVKDFIRNTFEGPASVNKDKAGLERPIDVKFGPDGALYILDLGKMDIKEGRERVYSGTGRVFKLVGVK